MARTNKQYSRLQNPPSPSPSSPLQKKSIGTGSKFPPLCLGLGGGARTLCFVFAHYRPFLFLIIREESASYCYGNDLILGQSAKIFRIFRMMNRTVVASYRGRVKTCMYKMNHAHVVNQCFEKEEAAMFCCHS